MISLDVTKNRETYIGGSDIAAVMGLSRYKTPLKLWAEKTGKITPEDISTKEAVRLGTDLEEFVAAQFTKETGKTVRKAPKAYTHKNYPYMVAHIDRIVTNTDELLECKTCSAFKNNEWENDEIPQEYILQVMWYLGITGRKIGHIACLIGGQKFVTRKIEFDAELFDKMVEAAKTFWEHVQKDIPVTVMANDDETLKALYSADISDFYIELYPEDEKTAEHTIAFEDKIAYLQELKMHIKEMQEEQKAIETTIKDIIKDNLGIKTPKYIITWKPQTKTSIDTTLLKKNEPEIVAKYLCSATYRVMTIKTNKGNEVA